MKEKRAVGRPEIPEGQKVKSVSRCITFKKDTFEMLEEMRGDVSPSTFINRLINDEYLRV